MILTFIDILTTMKLLPCGMLSVGHVLWGMLVSQLYILELRRNKNKLILVTESLRKPGGFPEHLHEREIRVFFEGFA